VWREAEVFAIMTIGPIRPGHCLVITTEQIDHWLDVPPQVWARACEVARIIGQAQMEVLRPNRIGLIVAGLEVPHCHLHVIPIDTEADLSFAKADTSVTPDELATTALALRENLVARGYVQAQL
jgi:diadenosine tetraphosphate (Ap4A) HIT family hydrolase